MEGGKKEPPHRNAGGTIAYKTKTKTGVNVIIYFKIKYFFISGILFRFAFNQKQGYGKNEI